MLQVQHAQVRHDLLAVHHRPVNRKVEQRRVRLVRHKLRAGLLLEVHGLPVVVPIGQDDQRGAS